MDLLSEEEVHTDHQVRHEGPKDLLGKPSHLASPSVGSPRHIFMGHKIGDCQWLTLKDMQSLRKTLVLNNMTADEGDKPAYVLQEGWDNEEINEYAAAQLKEDE